MKIPNTFAVLVLGLGMVMALAPFSLAQERRSERDLKSIAHGLEIGIDALRKLGRKEEAAHLVKIFREVIAAQERRQSGRRERRDAERRHRESDERAAGRRQLRTLRFAKEAFAEADREEALELTERWMHALEFAIEGRRDREARRAMERQPNLGNKVELLVVANKLLREFKAKEKAQAVGQFAEQLAGKLRRNRERESHRNNERLRERRERGERERARRQERERRQRREREERQHQRRRRREHEEEEREKEEEHEEEEREGGKRLERVLRQMAERIEELQEQMARMRREIAELRRRRR